MDVGTSTPSRCGWHNSCRPVGKNRMVSQHPPALTLTLCVWSMSPLHPQSNCRVLAVLVGVQGGAVPAAGLLPPCRRSHGGCERRWAFRWVLCCDNLWCWRLHTFLATPQALTRLCFTLLTCCCRHAPPLPFWRNSFEAEGSRVVPRDRAHLLAVVVGVQVREVTTTAEPLLTFACCPAPAPHRPFPSSAPPLP